MVKKTIVKKEIEYLQVLNEKGVADKKLEPKIKAEQLEEMYWHMVLARMFDRKAVNLQRQGRLLTYAPLEGQEACQVGSAYALLKRDWVFPAFRENGVFIIRGIPIKTLYAYWMGNEVKFPEESNNFTFAIPVASQLTNATGAAWAAKIRKDNIAVIVYFSDGATSEGDFHEALNFAGVYNLPIVFLCQNNQYAISTPRKIQTASKSLAQKAVAYGIKGVQVDGNDVLAVYKVTKEALDNARLGKGPTLIEAVTYRIGPHTTADFPKLYRTDKEVEEWRKKDPITRFERYLKKKKLLKDTEKIEKKAGEVIEKAVKEAETYNQNAEDMFNYVYKDLPETLKEQLDQFKQLLKEGGLK